MQYLKPLLYFFLVSVGLVIGVWLKPSTHVYSGSGDIEEIISLAKKYYVDSVNEDQLFKSSVDGMLQELDPHSVYIPASELRSVNEQLEGEFEGIGIEFTLYKDTIMVVTPLNGGPSQQAGLESGDRIITVDGKDVTGKTLTNEMVMKYLKGKKGTEVKLGIYRKGKPRFSVTIVRDKIPMYSVDAGYMIKPGVGYIKISRFAETTFDEFLAKLKTLKQEKLSHLIIDLRDNPGGFLNMATQICDELLDDKKLIVYTQGKNVASHKYKCIKHGQFEQGKLIILVNEGSASASEIVSGAVQDWDRGLIVGRRTFGKGLVQEQIPLSDGSAVRLTVSRYYTPSGRCIQKPYNRDHDRYESEVYERMRNGEYQHPDSNLMDKKQKYKTNAGRVVYGSGGIMPDIFVSSDTGSYNIVLNKLLQSGSLRDISIELNEKYKIELKRITSVVGIGTFWESKKSELQSVFKKASDETLSNAAMQRIYQYFICMSSRKYFGEEGFYYYFNQFDKTVIEALHILEQPSYWKSIR